MINTILLIIILSTIVSVLISPRLDITSTGIVLLWYSTLNGRNNIKLFRITNSWLYDKLTRKRNKVKF
jgi:hypothetical protein